MPTTCAISQSYETERSSSLSLFSGTDKTEGYSWGKSTATTFGSSETLSSSTENELSWEVAAEASIGFKKKVGKKETEVGVGASIGGSREWSDITINEEASTTFEEGTEESNEGLSEGSTTSKEKEQSWGQTESASIECAGEMEVPPSHSVDYTLIFNGFSSSLSTYTSLRLTLCSALIRGDGDAPNEDDFIYIHDVPGRLAHKETTGLFAFALFTKTRC